MNIDGHDRSYNISFINEDNITPRNERRVEVLHEELSCLSCVIYFCPIGNALKLLIVFHRDLYYRFK